jgi:hypothetical protein
MTPSVLRVNQSSDPPRERVQPHWLVAKINESIGQDADSKNFIGVLDIYGFESFKVGLYRLNPVWPIALDSAWFQPLNLSSDFLVSPLEPLK